MISCEFFYGRPKNTEEGLQEEFVNNFGAHKGSQRQLEPHQKEKLERVVEGDDGENPSDVHISDCEATETHPVGEPSLVILHVSVRLEGLNTLQARVHRPNQDGDLL